MKTNVRRVDIATCPNGRFDIHDFNGMGVEAATADEDRINTIWQRNWTLGQRLRDDGITIFTMLVVVQSV